MSTLKVNEYVFIVPIGDVSSLLYAPLHQIIVKVSPLAADHISKFLNGGIGMLREEERERVNKTLTDLGLFYLPPKSEERLRTGPKEKSRVTLSITNKCNLRCIYCYASSGMDNATMDFQVAKKSIDRVIEHAISFGNTCIEVKFHGGGEAFVEFPLLKECVEYARHQSDVFGLHLHLKIVTNTTLIDEERIKWIKENGIFVTASLDGSEEIQNYQRPNASGVGSFDSAIAAIKGMQKAGVPFELRATVTNKSVKEMANFVQFASEGIFAGGKGKIHFEPLSVCGRAEEGNLSSVDGATFIENYINAYELGKKLGIRVVCSYDSVDQIKYRHCGTSECTMFCVAPNGKVSACSRVTKDSDEGSEVFFYAEYEPKDKIFSFDVSKMDKIKEHGKLPKYECNTCFARWNCQGHCPVARYTELAYTENSCNVVRALLTTRLKKISEKGG